MPCPKYILKNAIYNNGLTRWNTRSFTLSQKAYTKTIFGSVSLSKIWILGRAFRCSLCYLNLNNDRCSPTICLVASTPVCSNCHPTILTNLLGGKTLGSGATVKSFWLSVSNPNMRLTSQIGMTDMWTNCMKLRFCCFPQ